MGPAAEGRQVRTIYAHLAADHTYLYIGQTGSLGERTATHRRGARWWPYVAQVVVLDVVPYADANWRERQLIGRHQPTYNWVFTERWRIECTAYGKTRRAA